MALGNILSGITKVFTSLGTGAAQLGSAVRAVGNTLFTGMAATGTGLSAAGQAGGGLSSLLGGGGGVLGNILQGAITQGLQGGLTSGLMSSVSGGGFSEGFKQGAIGGAVSGGVGAGVSSLFSPTGLGTAAGTATGFAPDPMAGGDTLIGNDGTAGRTLAGGGNTDVMVSQHAIERGRDAAAVGASAIPAAPIPKPPTVPTTNAFPAVPQAPAQPTGFGKLGDFLQSNAGAGLIGGIGESLMAERILEARAEEAEANRQYLRDEQKRKTDSYNVDDAVILGPGTKSSTGLWTYNPSTGMIERKTA
jgi:hypothetical protein